ncbi:spermatogenesis-defective protein 39 homolog [Anabrus simplex]|uniref:spermatogenesis-defective protein 39 homolog n=1 Tax=Anabrus simplex TaxID=316456 RepID=UPI0035A2C32A
MAGHGEDEEYWNDSETKTRARAFNFEEEEYGNQLCGVSMSGTARLSQQVRAEMGRHNAYQCVDSLSGSLSQVTVSGDHQTFSAPLSVLISDKALTCILDASVPYPREAKGPISLDEEVRILRRKVEDRWTPPPVNTTLTKIFLGHPYSLELYRSLELKTELLDASIKLGDGNAILAVVLFLVKTLKKSLVYKLLSTRPDAVAHYVQYLDTRMQLNELTDLLTYLGRNRDAAMKHFRVAVRSKHDAQRQLQRLRACASNHFSGPDSRDGEFVNNYIKLLEWEMAMESCDGEIAQNLVGKPVLDAVTHACRYHWGEPKGSFGSPLTLSHQQGVSDRQYRWTLLTVRAAMQAWEDIDNIFITKSWLGGKKLKAVVPMEEVVRLLHAHQAPAAVLMKYLLLIENPEKQVALVHKLQCHKVAIDLYISQRDRRALINYKANLSPQSEDYVYAENALQASTIRWKN